MTRSLPAAAAVEHLLVGQEDVPLATREVLHPSPVRLFANRRLIDEGSLSGHCRAAGECGTDRPPVAVSVLLETPAGTCTPSSTTTGPQAHDRRSDLARPPPC